MRYVEKKVDSEVLTVVSSRISKLPGKEYNDKNKVVQGYLLQLYSFRCGYCGVLVGQEWVGEIEHFYNQDEAKHVDHIKDLRNLHISCKRCNSKKSVIDAESLKMWSPNFLARSPKDSIHKNYEWFKIDKDDFKKAFRYRRSFLKVIGEPLPGYSAQQTVKELDLNGDKTRKYLTELRIRHFSFAKKMMDQVVALLEAAKSCNGCQQLTNYLLPLESLIGSFESLFDNDSNFAEMIRDNLTKDLILMKASYEELQKSVGTQT